jgi:hypothetical protein
MTELKSLRNFGIETEVGSDTDFALTSCRRTSCGPCHAPCVLSQTGTTLVTLESNVDVFGNLVLCDV